MSTETANSSAGRLKESIAVGLLKASSKLPLEISRILGAWVGVLCVILKTRMIKVTRENLSLCFPDMEAADRERLARQSVIETGKLMAETGAVWLRPYEWVKGRILRVHNGELLQQSLDQGRGVVLLAPHLGNWEVLGLYLSDVADITSLYQPPEMAALEPIIRQSREKVGAKLVPTNRRGVAALLKVIKNGGFTGILPDQVPEASGGDFAPFYGVPALTMTLVDNLRSRSDCLVIAAYAQRIKGGFEIHFLEADPGVYSSDQSEALVALNRTVENCVNGVPEQYQWEYKRFRRQPEGMPRRYKN